MNKTTFQISTQGFQRNYRHPWKKGVRRPATGSGFAVKLGKTPMVMTNAHVVSNDPFIHVNKWNSDKMYKAKIYDISPEVDLALLEVEDPEFWTDVPFFPIGDPPLKGDDVLVVGFPRGGTNASLTKGVVSRVEAVHYNDALLNMAIQIDAAVNRGNSGGPIFNGKEKSRGIVGVAFLNSTNNQLMCFMIPSFIVKHYLKTVETHKKFPGVCDLLIRTSNLKNNMLRKAVLGDDSLSGIMVNDIAPTGPAAMVLKVGDVIMNVDGVDVGSDGMIAIDDKYKPIPQIRRDISKAGKPAEIYEKVPYWQVLRMKSPGETINIKVSRDGKIMDLKCRLSAGPDNLVPILDTRMSMDYLVVGGFVFMPLNFWQVFSETNGNVPMQSVYHMYKLYNLALDAFKEFEDHEVVILTEVFPTNITVGTPVDTMARLVKINGEDVRNLAHVREICSAMKSGGSPISLEFDDHQIVKIDMNEEYNQTTGKISSGLITGGYDEYNP